ncbi:hypothetical protein SRHO_G00125040 [Serrasalmus rhombeus]
MSCLLFSCCRGRPSDSDTENEANEGEVKKDRGKIKRKKMWRTRKMKGQQKKRTKDVERAEESQARQQPAAGEKQSDVPHVPAGLGSGSLESISSVISSVTPQHDDLKIEAEAEHEAVKPLMCPDLDENDADNNQPLGDETTEALLTEAEVEAVKDLMLLFIDKIEADLLGSEVINVTDTEPEAPTLSMQTCLDEVDTPHDHPLEEEMFEVMDTDDHLDTETENLGDQMAETLLTEAEVEAIKDLMLLDKIEADLLGCEVINVTDTEPEAPTLSMQTCLDEVDTPHDHPLEEEMFEVMDTDDHLDTETENLRDQMAETLLTEAEVEAVKKLMLLFIDELEAKLLGCEVMSAADEVEASTHNMQTHLDVTDPSNDQPLDVEKKSNDEADWNTNKGLMADLLNDVQKTVDKSLGNEMHKDADVEVEAEDINKLTDTQPDNTKTTFNQALGKDVGMTVDPEHIKSWADIVDETEGNINQSAEIETLKKDIPENETKRLQQKKRTRRGTRGKEDPVDPVMLTLAVFSAVCVAVICAQTIFIHKLRKSEHCTGEKAQEGAVSERTTRQEQNTENLHYAAIHIKEKKAKGGRVKREQPEDVVYSHVIAVAFSMMVQAAIIILLLYKIYSVPAVRNSEPVVISAEPGKEVTITCIFVNDSSADVRMWYKQRLEHVPLEVGSKFKDKDPVMSPRFNQRRFKIDRIANGISLRIEHVTKEDEGMYFCGLDRQNAMDFSTATFLAVTASPVDPTVFYLGAALGICVIVICVQAIRNCSGRDHDLLVENKASQDSAAVELSYAAKRLRMKSGRSGHSVYSEVRYFSVTDPNNH